MTHNEPDHFPDARKMVDLAARIERAEGPDEWCDSAHDALNRMRRAHERGTGCHLTADMIEAGDHLKGKSDGNPSD